MSAVELLSPTEATPDNDVWHQLRRNGITASEIAAVLGISPWESAFSLYWRKANDWRDEGNVFTSAGRHLEDAIADWWMAECDPLQNLQARPAGLYANPDRPWQLATPDRLLYMSCPGCDGESFRSQHDGSLWVCTDCMEVDGCDPKVVALLECKWVGQPTWDGWGEPGTDEIPVYYRAQVLWQADVLGVSEVHIAALGPGGFRAYVVRIDDAARVDLDVMRSAGLTFFDRFEHGEAPDLDSHSATVHTLQRLHPDLGDGDLEVELELAERYRMARLDRDNAKARVAKCEAEIRSLLGSEYARLVHNKRLVASRSIFERRSDDEHELLAIDDDWPITDRLNPGKKLEIPYA